MTARDAPLSTRELAGYRILRSLARDDRAELLLGHRVITPLAGDAADADDGDGAVIETVALKVVPSTAEGWESVRRLGEVFGRARGDHVVDFRDVDADEHSIRLVFERLPRGDLASLLGIRPSWEAGEAVTVLAPVVTTLQRLHAGGVAHGALSARAVMFRDDGAPTLIGFSAAELFEPGAPEVVLEEVAAVVRDREAMRGLTLTVLDRVAGTRARSARELRAEVADVDGDLLLAFLASRLFEVAAALPVRFTADEVIPDAAASTERLVPVAAAPGGVSGGDSDGDPDPDARAAPGGVLAVALGRLVPEHLAQRVVDAAERSPAAPVVRALAVRWASWSARRRRIVLAVGAAAFTIAVVTVVVPASGASSPAAPVPPPGSAGTVPAGTAPAMTGSASAPARAGNPALTGNDPVAAVSALLTARNRCLASLSLRCLDGVDEAGSGALKDDQAAIRVAQQGGELPDPTLGAAGKGAPVLIERLGDSALVRLGPAASGSPTDEPVPSPSQPPDSGPASLLLVKGEAGWRIRDVIAARQSG